MIFAVSNFLGNTIDVVVMSTCTALPQHPLCWVFCGAYCSSCLGSLCEVLSDVLWLTFGFQTEKSTETKKDRRSHHPQISNTPFMLGSTPSLGSLLWVWTASKSQHFVIRSFSWLHLNITFTLRRFDAAPTSHLHRACQSNGHDFSRRQTSPSQSRRKIHRQFLMFSSFTTRQATVAKSTSAFHLLVRVKFYLIYVYYNNVQVLQNGLIL